MTHHTQHPDVRAAAPPQAADAWDRRLPSTPAASAIPAVTPPGGVVRRRARAAAAAVGAGAVLAVGLAARGGRDVGRVSEVGGGAAWAITVASDGPRAVTALVFGREAGLHVVRVPPAGAPTAEWRQVAARLGAGDVYLVSLGRDPLAVGAASPAGTPRMTLAARSRFVKLHHDARGTGVRTGWW